MTKPALMHGCDWTGEDVSGWWASEKIDGWRAYWDGSNFISRQGKTLDAPDWFKAGMPSTPLDGELYAGPGTTHDDVSAAVLRKEWSKLTYHPFDIPVQGFKVEAIPGALASLQLPSHAQPIRFFSLETTEQAIAMMRQIADAGGEGLMLRAPRSGYSPDFRTGKLLKLKPSFVRN